MARKKKERVSGPVDRRLVCMMGTLAHNRRFSLRDLRDYSRFDHEVSGVRLIKRSTALVRTMERRGFLEKLTDGYFPTPKGWRAIERACRCRGGVTVVQP